MPVLHCSSRIVSVCLPLFTAVIQVPSRLHALALAVPLQCAGIFFTGNFKFKFKFKLKLNSHWPGQRLA